MRSLHFFDGSRRDFLSYFGATTGAWMVYHIAAMHSKGWARLPQEFAPSEASAGGPANPDWRATLVSATELGQPLIISGVVYSADGRSPVSGARLYVYHTDSNGLYTLNGGDNRRPRLRGWMRTTTRGEYEFRTIQPAPYPGRRIPSHIHATISAPGYAERWLPDQWFEGDPFLARRNIIDNIGKGSFSQILKLNRSADGTLCATHDILLA